MKIKNKSGFIYTFISLFAVTVILFISFISTAEKSSTLQDTIQERVLVMDDFLNSFKQDAVRAAFISGFRTLIAMEDYVSSNGVYLKSSRETFREIFYNGSFNGTNFTIMNDSTFFKYEERVANLANEIDLNFQTSVTDINLYHTNPWILTLNITLVYNLTDNKGVASWYDTINVISDVLILDIRDPLYSVETLGKLPVVIKKTNVTTFVNDSSNRNDSSGIQWHINNSLYQASNRAPSFIQRFEKNLTPSEYGIESMVNIQVLIDQDFFVGTNTKSIIDYIYFNETANTTNYCNIQTLDYGSPAWIAFDEESLTTYQINGSLDSSSC